VATSVISWESEETHWLINPRASEADQFDMRNAKSQAPKLNAHIWLQSSGSRESKKWIALSKTAFLASARGVCKHLEVKSSDVWLKCLPNFHVGGLSILARAFCAGFSVVEQESWCPRHFVDLAEKNQVSISSLVPTQVFDLVQARLAAPKSLRAIVVGGDQLRPEVYTEARGLGWPVLLSYGSTETCSQIATSSLRSLEQEGYPGMDLLPHVSVDSTEKGTLKVYSECLYSGVLKKNHKDLWSFDKRKQPYHLTTDFVSIKAGVIVSVEREQDRLKVLGELVSLGQLRNRLQKTVQTLGLNSDDFELLSVPEARKGQLVALLAVSNLLPAVQLMKHFNEALSVPEQIKQIYLVDEIPRSDLGKLQARRAVAGLAFKN
jgi:O-succinylbenzoic acid--CoA ligase